MRGARGLSFYKLEAFLTNHWLQGHNDRKLSFLELHHIFFNTHLSLHLSFEKVIVGTRVRDVFKSYFLHATERDFFRNYFFTMQIIFVCLGIKYILINLHIILLAIFNNTIDPFSWFRKLEIHNHIHMPLPLLCSMH